VLIAVIADTHMPKGNRRLPAACLELLGNADLIIHAGDFVSEEVLIELEALGPPVEAVHGNVDSWDLVKRLPVEKTLRLAETSIGIVHDAGATAGRLARLRASFPDADAVVFGHSHMPLLERDPSGFQIFNPGSPTERRRAPSRTMGVARVEHGGIAFEHVVLE
jgi:putative phosphoesterase